MESTKKIKFSEKEQDLIEAAVKMDGQLPIHPSVAAGEAEMRAVGREPDPKNQFVINLIAHGIDPTRSIVVRDEIDRRRATVTC